MQFLRSGAVRHMLYEQRGGYILLPGFIMLVLGLVALVLPIVERSDPMLAEWAKQISHTVPSDPSMAQLMLGAVAGSCITVVSVVYSILLIALTFASIQFSPRILRGFLKDTVSQITLGMFTGTFSYCLLLLPSIHGAPRVFVPTLSLSFAVLLAGVCLFYLIYFIHHIAMAIQANYIVDKIAKESAEVLRSLFGTNLKGFPKAEEAFQEPSTGTAVASPNSGYIQYIDEGKLLKLATEQDAVVYVHRGVGQFIPAGVSFITISLHGIVSELFKHQCLSCFHVGPVRSMESDVEFGFLQIVDIALKAISPAVNDPSTAICCIDHLSSLLILATQLEPPTSRIYDDNATVRLLRRQTSFPRLLEIAYDQISPYGKGDMAVSLRLMRALHDISGVTNYPPYLDALRTRAQRIAKACSTCFPEEQCTQLIERLVVIESRSRDAS
jgi:uncharacterized membrane protein